MRFHCIGVGSIGTLLAFNLRRDNLAPKHAVSLILNKQSLKRTASKSPITHLVVEKKAVRRQVGGFDIELVDLAQESAMRLVSLASSSTNQASRKDRFPRRFSGWRDSHPPIESLFVTNKAPSVEYAFEHLGSRLDASSTVVLLQNGMGIYERVIDRFFPDPDSRPNFIIGSVTHGVFAKRPLDVVHAGEGEITFSIVPDVLGRRNFDALPSLEAAADTGARQYSEVQISNISTAVSKEQDPKFYSLSETVRALQRCKELNAKWVPWIDMQVVLRRKIVVNSCVGPLTGLLQCHNGALYGNTYAGRVIRAICSEAASTFRKEREAALETGLEVSSRWEAQLSQRALEEEVLRVIRATSTNYSSMCLDVKNNKTTEIEFTNGHLASLAQTFDVPAHCNNTLMELIRLRRSLPSL